VIIAICSNGIALVVSKAVEQFDCNKGENDMRNSDAELISLGRALHSAALQARNEIEALPDDIDVDGEYVAIMAASATANELAERIIGLPADAVSGVAVKTRAVAWLDGRYWH
jgi:hypothetical protein